MGPNFSKLGVRKDTSVSFTTRPSVSTKPLGQANLTFTAPEVEEKPIPVICEKEPRAEVDSQCLHGLRSKGIFVHRIRLLQLRCSRAWSVRCESSWLRPSQNVAGKINGIPQASCAGVGYKSCRTVDSVAPVMAPDPGVIVSKEYGGPTTSPTEQT